MSIFDVFKTSGDSNAATSASGSNTNNSNDNTAVVSTDSTTSTSVQPAAPGTVPSAAAPVDPLATLWEASTTDASATPYSLGLTPEALAQVAAKLNVSATIPDTIKSRIAAGGQDAITAMMELQDATGRELFQRNTQVTAALIERAVQQTQESMLGVIDQRFKTLGIRDNLMDSNPALKDPSVAPLVTTIQQQVIAKFPQASKEEVAAMTNSYFNRVALALNPNLVDKTTIQQKSANPNMQQSVDWADYLFGS